MRGKFFSKLKDYNYILDQLLEKKAFNQNVKNLLLSMVYKVESSYDDYTKIKRNTLTQNVFIENIIIKAIRDYCNQIYLVNPRDEEVKILEKQNALAITNEKEKKIYAYPTELAILYALSDIRPKYFFIPSKYKYIRHPFQAMLVEGTDLNNTEVIRNFNGWSWNLETDSSINNTYNSLFQLLILLFGQNFLTVWEEDSSGKKDYIEDFRKRMEQGYGKAISDEFFYAFCNVLVLNYKEKDKLKIEYEKLLDEFNAIADKEKYTQSVNLEKKKIITKLNRIDKVSEDGKLLLKEFESRNSKLPSNRQIFSVSELADILAKEKEDAEKILGKLSNLLKDEVYEKNKNTIEEKLKVLKPFGDKHATVYKYLVSLQKSFLKCIAKEVELADKKEDYINLVYTIRYYRNIHLTDEKTIKEIPEINNTLDKIACKLITIMCKKSILNIFCKDIAMNYRIILRALNSAIVDIDDIDICLKLNKEKDILTVQIYEAETIDSSIEIEYPLEKRDLNIRQKKHVPLVNF